MKKKVSIRDIAKQLNISITTVSFIINGKAKEKRISDDLIKKVERLVKEVDYKPNQLALSLRTGKTRIIGLMVENIANPFFSNIARLIEENAYKKGYRIIYCSTENKKEKTTELINMFKDRHVDGYIITPPKGVEEDIRSLIQDSKLPVILFDRHFPGLQATSIVVDNHKSTYEAIKYFIQQGYKKIAFVTVHSEQSQMVDRLKGYRQALRENELPHYVQKVNYHNATEKTIGQLCEFLESNREIDAVFFATNYLALRGLEAIKRINRKIPDEIGVITFDDHDIFSLYNPPITAVAQPIGKIAKELINSMLKQLNNPDEVVDQTIVLPCTLIIRQSTTFRENGMEGFLIE